MATINISLPDSPEMRKVLRQLAAHLADDTVPFYTEEEPDARMAAACELVDETITQTLAPAGTFD